MSAKKKYFTIIFIHILHKACQIPSAFTNYYYSLHLQSVPLSSSQSKYSHPIHCHSTTYHHQSHTLHWIYTTFKILHSHFWWDAVPCHYDPHRL